ncbi:MAG: BatD family protein [Gammaproteobacteria bacterium]
MAQHHFIQPSDTHAIVQRNKRRLCRFINWRWLLWLAFIAVPAIANASVTAQVDRNTINEGDTFTLTLTVTGNNHAQPDLSGLQQDFDVLGTGQKNMIQIINGSVSSNRSWTVTLSPKHTGKLTIPPIRVGSDTSNAVSVTVLPASAASGGSPNQADVFLQVSVKPEHKSYVQSQLLYTVRLYYAEPLQQGTLSDPSVGNAIVQKLGKDSHFSTMHGGRQYHVIERRYAIFPQQSGKLKIPGVVFDGQVKDPSAQSGNSFFDSFSPPTRHVHLRARTLDLHITSQPASYGGNNWLPAQDIQLADKWTPNNPTFRVGEPVTRSLVIHAKGLSSSQLPDLSMPQQPDLKLYPDQAQTSDKADGDTLDATRKQKIAMIPTRAGKLTLPAIHLTWWDTRTQRQRTSSLPAETINVLPAAASTNNTMPAGGTQSGTTASATGSSHSAQPSSPAATSTSTPAITNHHRYSLLRENIWMILAIIFAIAWLITAWLLWRQRKPQQDIKSDNVARRQSTEPTGLRHVQLACRQNDPRAVRHALLSWARTRWPDNPPLSLGAMAQLLQDETLCEQIEKLDKALYNPQGASWHAENLLQSFSAYLKQTRQTKPYNDADKLAPLYLQKRKAG